MSEDKRLRIIDLNKLYSMKHIPDERDNGYLCKHDEIENNLIDFIIEQLSSPVSARDLLREVHNQGQIYALERQIIQETGKENKGYIPQRDYINNIIKD